MTTFISKSNIESIVDIIENQVVCKTTIRLLRMRIFHIQVTLWCLIEGLELSGRLEKSPIPN